jgi:hypothetical protein
MRAQTGASPVPMVILAVAADLASASVERRCSLNVGLKGQDCPFERRLSLAFNRIFAIDPTIHTIGEIIDTLKAY